MYLTPNENMWACDIEADDLLDKATTIWCATLENCVSGDKTTTVTAEEFETFQKEHPDAVFVGHNFLAYDAPMLNKFWKAGIRGGRIVDTFVLSQLYHPSLARPLGLAKKKGPHSLEAWGLRLKHAKTGFDDFSKFTPEMLEYCQTDTALTAKLYRRLSERMRQVGFSEDGCELEHHAWNIIQNKQRKNGFPFLYEKASGLYAHLRQREEELRAEIYRLWPPALLPIHEYKRPFRQDGQPTANYQRHLEQFTKLALSEDKTSYTVFDYVSFNLGSPSQRIEKLLELGWQPVSFTKKTEKGGGGNPQVDEDSLLEFAEVSGKPEVAALAKWIVINSRANMIRTWMDAYDERTRSIHGRLFIASTLRYRHSNPNSANIPAVRLKRGPNGDIVQYGEDGGFSYESRDLWGVDDDEWRMVGIDATGIQNRCLIHYLIKTVGEERVAPFLELALRGDIHKHNIEVLGLANKAAAKKFYYSLMMGAGGPKLAADQAQFGTKMTGKEGKARRDRMIESIPGFRELIKKLETELDRTGRIKLCDGTPIVVPSPHMVIPYVLQGDESRLMKRSMIYVDEVVTQHRWTRDVFKVADIHDEWQFKVRRDRVDDFISAALPCFPRAGEYYNYLVPIDGAAKGGMTWARTH